jgi:hypothetical protein
MSRRQHERESRFEVDIEQAVRAAAATFRDDDVETSTTMVVRLWRPWRSATSSTPSIRGVRTGGSLIICSSRSNVSGLAGTPALRASRAPPSPRPAARTPSAARRLRPCAGHSGPAHYRSAQRRLGGGNLAHCRSSVGYGLSDVPCGRSRASRVGVEGNCCAGADSVGHIWDKAPLLAWVRQRGPDCRRARQ